MPLQEEITFGNRYISIGRPLTKAYLRDPEPGEKFDSDEITRGSNLLEPRSVMGQGKPCPYHQEQSEKTFSNQDKIPPPEVERTKGRGGGYPMKPPLTPTLSLEGEREFLLLSAQPTLPWLILSK
jgi:hypothetical protein